MDTCWGRLQRALRDLVRILRHDDSTNDPFPTTGKVTSVLKQQEQLRALLAHSDPKIAEFARYYDTMLTRQLRDPGNLLKDTPAELEEAQKTVQLFLTYAARADA